jgi:hypothetical protein
VLEGGGEVASASDEYRCREQARAGGENDDDVDERPPGGSSAPARACVERASAAAMVVHEMARSTALAASTPTSPAAAGGTPKLARRYAAMPEASEMPTRERACRKRTWVALGIREPFGPSYPEAPLESALRAGMVSAASRWP